MGTSWYDPGGPTPNFVSGQTNGTTYTARLGEDALLDCRVTSLERDLVSWFREAAARMPYLRVFGDFVKVSPGNPILQGDKAGFTPGLG